MSQEARSRSGGSAQTGPGWPCLMAVAAWDKVLESSWTPKGDTESGWGQHPQIWLPVTLRPTQLLCMIKATAQGLKEGPGDTAPSYERAGGKGQERPGPQLCPHTPHRGSG